MESIEQMVQKIDVFFVKDKNDVLKAHHALKTFGVPVFKSDGDLRKFEISDSDIKNNFLMRDKDGGWRIQSHYIGNGFPVEELVILSESYSKIVGSLRVKVKDLGDEIIRMIERVDSIDYFVYTEYNKNVLLVKKSGQDEV